MSKKVKRPVVSAAAPTKPSKPSNQASNLRKYLLLGGGLLILSGVAYYFWGKRDTSSKPKLEVVSGSEPSLTAKNPRLQLLTPGETGVDFENYILEDSAHNIILNLNQYNCGGVAIIDLNNDNQPDIYFVSSSGKNRLFLNESQGKGSLKFKDITDSAGVGDEEGFKTSATVVDVNADGWMDLFVCHAGPDLAGRVAKLYINNKNLTFSESAESYGLADKAPCTGANFFDYDNDGDLDCYVINYPTDLVHANRITLKYGPDGKTTVPDLDPKAEYDSDVLYRNDGGKFVNVSKQAGIQNFGYGLSVNVSDVSGDGWPDIYVANDFVQPDNFFINNQKGGFTDQITRYFQHTTMSTMGTELTDFDNDARVDLFAVDMYPATNYRQKLLQ